MDKIDAYDPYSRPARRTQWIVSTLAYHYGLDRGVENEIIVLATGLDQYLQEIFHHMDSQGDGKIPAEDFKILCQVLGLNKDCDLEECAGILENIPHEFTFRQFHAKLCGYFSTKAGCQYESGRLLVGRESEHIETQIRLRSPLRRRGKVLSAGAKGRLSRGSSPTRDRHSSDCKQLGSCTRECYEEIVALEEAEDRIAKLEDENASLRELVEDMRAALQSSDARALALQVGLWKSHTKHSADGGCFISHQKVTVAQKDNGFSLQNFFREIELIRSSRDEQVKEAMFFNQKLEKELQRSQEALLSLEDSNRKLKREQGEMRKKVEEARQAVLNSLGKVKELEVKANRVPLLQRRIQQLESELLYFRSYNDCSVFLWTFGSLGIKGSSPGIPFTESPSKGLDAFFGKRSEVSKVKVPISRAGGPEFSSGSGTGRRCCLNTQQDRRSPTGRSEAAPENMEEQLFRSVEGQAASDEEEEKWTGKQQSQVDEVKRILTRLSCCGERCDDKAVRKLLSHFGGTRSEENQSAMVELLEKVTRLNKQLEIKETLARKAEMDMDQMKDSLLLELQQKAEETELLHMELQMLETERVRLSLVEEKLMDVLQLLQKLRDLNVSRRSLGKILLSTLESCSDPQHGKAHILEVLNALYHELAACELLASAPLERTQSHQSLTNALLITC